ncbi:VOC family protein [Alkalihalobacillus sp. LMS39]|uniref:VOC family protein n=1 Tax=Alkalihalobacillus sp. LMS39 TaxID=2924032 RepID=UPI001FB31B81|nr:VOC family protein [Alkalihalobacillus sp. LMS39]UOE95795.1 VOC family protein [Alkalihalobacillus sp. LMS39]
MIFELTIQIRVSDFTKGQLWYETLLNRKPDFIPHDGFAEWEVIPGCWLQLAEGKPSIQSGPLRFGVPNLELEKQRLIEKLAVNDFEVFSREEVPVKWATFSDPWGNQIGLFEYFDKNEEQERMKTIIGG